MLKRHLSATAITTAVSIAANLFRQLILYKNLSVDVIGQYIFVGTIIVFLQPMLSANVKVYLISKAPELPEREGFSLLKTVFLWETAMGAVGFTVFFLLFRLGISLTSLSPILADTSLLYWGVALSVSSSLFSQFQRYLSNTLRITTGNAMEIVSSVLYTALLGLFVLVLGHRGVGYVFLSWGVSTFVAFLVLVVMFRRQLIESPFAPFAEIGRGVRFSVPSLSTEFGGAIVGYFDRITVGHYMSAASLGLYGFIYNIVNIAQVAARSVIDSLFGSYFLFALKSKREEMASIIVDVYLRCSILAGLSVLAFFVAAGKQFILAVGKPEMLPSYRLFFVLWPLFIINAFIPVLSLFLHYVSEERRKIVKANAVIIPVSVVLYIFSIRYFHLMGACLSSTATAALTFGAMAWQSPEWRAKPVRALLNPRALATGVISVGVALAVRRPLSLYAGDVPAVVIGIVLSVAVAVIAGVLTGYVSNDDRRKLSALNRLRSEPANA